MRGMSPIGDQPPVGMNEEGDFGHPRGTLAIVIGFALLFAVGWFVMFLFRFMDQGTPHH